METLLGWLLSRSYPPLTRTEASWPLVYSMAELNTFQVPSFDTVATLLESEEKEKLYTPLVCPV